MATPSFSQLQGSPGTALAIMVSGQNPDGTSFELPVTDTTTTSADVLNGFLTFSGAASAQTILTVPAGRTWSGTITVTVAADIIGTASSAVTCTATVLTAGSNVVPAAGTWIRNDVILASPAASGLSEGACNTVGPIPFVVIAPSANSVTLVFTTVSTNPTAAQFSVMAIGALL